MFLLCSCGHHHSSWRVVSSQELFLVSLSDAPLTTLKKKSCSEEHRRKDGPMFPVWGLDKEGIRNI